MARATFTIQRNGKKIGSASFLGKSYDAAKAIGARALSAVGIKRSNPTAGRPKHKHGCKCGKVTNCYRKGCALPYSEQCAACRARARYSTNRKKRNTAKRRAKAKPRRKAKRLSFGQRMARLRKSKARKKRR